MLWKTLNNLSLPDIESLADNGVAEGHHLDFKGGAVGNSDDERREFLADVSAFANASGGDIIFGVTEVGGAASAVPGCDMADWDREELRLRNLVRDGLEPRLTNLEMRWLPIRGNRGVLVVRVGRSWIAPHRVTLRGHDKFYLRDSNGKHPMNVDELRQAFTFAESVAQRIRHFSAERTSLVRADKGPVALRPGVVLVVHLVPLASIVDPPDLQFDYNNAGIVPPPGASGFNYLHTLEGYATFSGPESGTEAARAYSLMFRTGAVELVCRVAEAAENGRYLSLRHIEEYLNSGWQRYRSFMANFGLEPPVYVFVNLLNVHGFQVRTDSSFEGNSTPVRRDDLSFPPIQITSDQAAADPSVLFARTLDTVGNAFGLARFPRAARA